MFTEAVEEALTIHVDWSQSLDGYGMKMCNRMMLAYFTLFHSVVIIINNNNNNNNIIIIIINKTTYIAQ